MSPVKKCTRKTLEARCIQCNELIRKRRGMKKVIFTPAECTKFSKSLRKTVKIGDILCERCRLYARTRKVRHEEIPAATSSNVRSLVDTLGIEDLTVNTSSVDYGTGCRRNIGDGPIALSSFSQFSITASTSSDPIFTLSTSLVKSDREYVEMSFNRVISTHPYCFICGSTRSIINVPIEARKHFFYEESACSERNSMLP